LSTPPNPDSLFAHRGRTVELKVHRCLWSGAYSENSPLAIEECGRENVLRTEIDVQLLRDGEFVLFPGVYPPIQGAEKVAPNMVPMDNPSEEEAKSLSNEFRRIFFAQ